jgi:hypothetical protein
VTTYDELEAQARRMLTDPIYKAGYREGLAGTTPGCDDILLLERAAWVDGLRDGAAEANETRQSIMEWMTRSRRRVGDA